MKLLRVISRRIQRIDLFSWNLEKKKKLYEQEATWRLKSSIVWLMARDDNTKKIHNVAKGKKSTNTIWELHDLEGNRASLFEDLANMGKSHFESLFK